MILVSFVVPAYNEEALIERCLDSILREIDDSYPASAEIIIVDNNSTDRTVELVQKFLSHRVRLIHEPKQGLVQARKAGYLAAKGKYVANVDADIVMPLGWINSALHVFDLYPRVVAITGPYDYYDLSPLKRIAVNGYYALAFPVYIVVKHVFRLGAMLTGGNAIILKSALDACDPYPDNFTFYGEDTELARRLSTVGDVVFKQSRKMPTSARRLREQGMVSTAFQYIMNFIWSNFFKRPFTSEWKNYRKSI
jgi:glycosyltransferase involved in cell wall biosynthesis